MRLKKIFYAISTILLISSCATTSFYQVYNVKPIENSITNTEELFYEDENCKISYNLWSNGGNIGFNIYNKTDKYLHIKLDECYFVLNGFAYDYFKSRTYTTSESKFASSSNSSTGSVAFTGINVNNNIQTNQVKNTSSTNLSSSVGYSVSIIEDKLISIPPNTTKRISEYSINNVQIRNCELFKYPNTREINTKLYTTEKSPIVFSNRITYEIDGNSKLVENEFYVSEITNYPESEFFESKYEEYCGQKCSYMSKHYKFYDIDKFYIKYKKGTDYWKH